MQTKNILYDLKYQHFFRMIESFKKMQETSIDHQQTRANLLYRWGDQLELYLVSSQKQLFNRLQSMPESCYPHRELIQASLKLLQQHKHIEELYLNFKSFCDPKYTLYIEMLRREHDTNDEVLNRLQERAAGQIFIGMYYAWLIDKQQKYSQVRKRFVEERTELFQKLQQSQVILNDNQEIKQNYQQQVENSKCQVSKQNLDQENNNSTQTREENFNPQQSPKLEEPPISQQRKQVQNSSNSLVFNEQNRNIQQQQQQKTHSIRNLFSPTRQQHLARLQLFANRRVKIPVRKRKLSTDSIFQIQSHVSSSSCDLDEYQDLGLSNFGTLISQSNLVQNQEVCAICCQNFLAGDKIPNLKVCAHTFHTVCINEWLDKKNECPLCKRAVREKKEIYLENDDFEI